METKQQWDAVYRNHSPPQLPWYHIAFLSHVNGFLKKIGKKDLLIITGCGIGDTVQITYKKGFTNSVGTDISSEAIIRAKKRFQHLKFKRVKTESVHNKYKNANVLDWLNLHQISPENLGTYLNSLAQVSKSLLLVYFYDPARQFHQKSLVTGGFVYNYSPKNVSKLLKPLKKTSEFSFKTRINTRFKQKQQFMTIGQVYSKD